jgi:hypothetical protein
MIKVIDKKLLPEHLSFGKSIVKVNKICYIEKMDSKLYKSNLNLGIVQTLNKTDEGADFFLPKEEVFRLDSLYRCIIDTGILLDSIPEVVDYTVESHSQYVTVTGLMVLAPVKFNDNGVLKLGVSVVNLSSVHINITKYMKFAVLVLKENIYFEIPFSHE